MRKNLILCVDSNKNYYRIPKNDPRYLSGELKSACKGIVTVKDFDGNFYSVSKNDPRYLSGEFVFISKGLVDVIYNGKIFKCKPNDPLILNDTYKIIKNKKYKYVDKITNEIYYLNKEDPKVINNEVEKYLNSVVTVRDKNGLCFDVFKNDIRLKTNEVFYVTSKYIIDCEIHGPTQIIYHKRKKATQLPEKYKIYCERCIQYYLSNEFIPNQKDIEQCKLFLSEYKFISSNQQTEGYFKKYLPKYYSTIMYEFNKEKHSIPYKNLSFSQIRFLFKMDFKIPICKEKNCNNHVSLYKNNRGFHLFCKEHIINYSNSKKEIEMFYFVKNLNQNVISRYKKNRMEIDVFLPNLNIGFEFNGIWWHSEEFRKKDYHYKKYNYFKNNNVDLITIWEDSWDNKQDIVKSIIKRKLNIFENTINSSDCIIKNVNFYDKTEFLEKNHLYGTCISSINLGLYYNDKLISMMNFKRKENNSYELTRFCSLLNTNIIDDASRLFKYFLEYYKPNNVLFFMDCDMIENFPKILNFKECGHTGINYWWAKRIRYHHNNLKNKLIEKGCDPKISKDELLIDNGYFKIYGSGVIKYEYVV